MHAPTGAENLVGERLGRDRLRVGVRHLEHGGDAAEHRGAGARLQILLVGKPRLAEVDLGVDHARQDVKAGALDHAPGRGARKIAERGDPAGGDSDVALGAAVVVDDGAAAQDQV